MKISTENAQRCKQSHVNKYGKQTEVGEKQLKLAEMHFHATLWVRYAIEFQLIKGW